MRYNIHRLTKLQTNETELQDKTEKDHTYIQTEKIKRKK